MTVVIGDELSFKDVIAVAGGDEVVVSDDLTDAMAAARRIVDEAVEHRLTVYGITTGIGDLANIRIPPQEAAALQADIVRSHATAVGDPLASEAVRAIMLLKARTFAFGISGVRADIVHKLAELLNARIHPVVPAQGSLGASGDLALLAHMALPLIGEGKVEHQGRVQPTMHALRSAGIEPLTLSYKEGLSLVNGTEPMLALGILSLNRVRTVTTVADVTGAMTTEACLGTDRAFDERVVGLRRHPGALQAAANQCRLLAASEIVGSHRTSDHLVQDAYSLRCIPQVHGAYRDALHYVETTLNNELASAIDNPSVITADAEVLSSGNFHGEALALALDHMTLCVAGFATIAERRIARLVDPGLNNGLPAFLTTDPGRRSGFMLAQYTAASLVSESRSASFPASSDSIPTSAGQEDHVSMGMTSARKAASVIANTERVLAIEALAAAQGLELRAPLAPAPGTGAALHAVRRVSPPLENDRSLAPDIEACAALIRSGDLGTEVTAAIGPLD